jgi:hypothetical protein
VGGGRRGQPAQVVPAFEQGDHPSAGVPVADGHHGQGEVAEIAVRQGEAAQRAVHVGIESGKGWSRPVQLVLSLCKHVQVVWRDGPAGRYEIASWSSRGRQTYFGLTAVAGIARALPPARKQVIVGFVGPNPEPVHVIAAPPRHGPVASSDLCGPDVALPGETK